MNPPQRAQPCMAARLMLAAALPFCARVSIAAAATGSHLMLIPQTPVGLIRGTSMFVVDAPVALLPGDLLTTDTRHGTVQLEAIDAPFLSASIKRASIVVHATIVETELFVKTGEGVVFEPEAHPASIALSDDFYIRRKPGAQPEQEPRPPGGFVSQLPVAFRDPLAPLPGRTPAPDAPLSQAQDVTYADIADWLNSPLPMRRTFVHRFRTLAQQDPFRCSIRRNLADLPEWRPVLYPPPLPRPHWSNRQCADKENS
ncbi:hypothetical protein AB3X96_39900 [Paraburkholderia sp. BR13439]|uniref:hypothetical protein n=1 Tax=Paraburkholderia sp. BR13439 TaxID=3236996 RepID=UPI0034CF8135